MTALKATPAAQNLLAEPAPQAGQPGPVTLILGGDFAGVNPPASPDQATGKGKAAAGSGHGVTPASQTTVQSRNAAASICSGLPAANPNPGTPPGG